MSRYSNHPALSQRELVSALVRRRSSAKPISISTTTTLPSTSSTQQRTQNSDSVLEEEDNDLHIIQQSLMDTTLNSEEEMEKQEKEIVEALSPSSKILTARLLLLKSVCFAQNVPLKETATVLSEDLNASTAPLHSTSRQPMLTHQTPTTTVTLHGLDAAAAAVAKQLPLGYKHKHWHQRHRITLSRLLGSLSLTLEQVIILALFVAFLWFQFAVEFGTEFAVLRTTSRPHRFFSTSRDQSSSPSTTSPASAPFGSCSSSTKQHSNLF